MKSHVTIKRFARGDMYTMILYLNYRDLIQYGWTCSNVHTDYGVTWTKSDAHGSMTWNHSAIGSDQYWQCRRTRIPFAIQWEDIQPGETQYFDIQITEHFILTQPSQPLTKEDLIHVIST